MTHLPIALMSAGAAALIHIWLQLRIIQIRRNERVEVGDGGNDRLARRMRAHLNFAESVPLVIILLALIEYSLGTSLWLWIVAALFLFGRAIHPIGMDGWMPARQIGMVLTIAVTLVLAGTALMIPYLAIDSTSVLSANH